MVLAEEFDRGSTGNCSMHFSMNNSWPTPLQDARALQETRLYEEHSSQNKLEIHKAKLPYAQPLTIVSFNTRSLLKTTMHSQLVSYMQQRNVHVMCLQETRSKQTTQYLVDKYTFMTITTAPDDKQEFAGIGFVLSPAARKALLRLHFLNSRLASITLLTAAGELTIINCYVPQNGRPEAERRTFFEELHSLVEKVQQKGPFILVGDFNARLHGKLHGEETVLGPHLYGRGISGIGDEHDNRAYLIDFCSGNNLLVANTWFQKPQGKQVTYHEPGVQTLPATNAEWDPTEFAQLDLCLVPSRWRNACVNVYSQPRANLDSDHFPLHVTLCLKLGARPRRPPAIAWDFPAATTQHVIALNKTIEERLLTHLPQSDPTQRWEALETIFHEAIDTNIPKRRHKPRKPWIKPDTLALIETRGRLREQGDLAQVKELTKQIRTAAKANKREWLDQQLETGDWQPITNLKKPFVQKVLRLQGSGQGQEDCTDSNAEVYAQHLAHVQWADAGVPHGLAEEPILTSLPTISLTTISLAETLTAIRQSKAGKRGGKDMIPNNFWKGLSGKGLEELVALFQLCRETRTSPHQWKVVQVVGIFKKGSACDPANYRPISLLQTCYKLYARILANRPSIGLDEHIRELQFGFRQGRSTAEAIFLVRRLQDLVDAKKYQVLHLMFLDWSKAFDKIRPAALRSALVRLRVPQHMVEVVCELVANPLFEVTMDHEASQIHEQRSGIRQGCTLSPLLFILLQTVLFHDVQAAYLDKYPLAATPTIPFFDVEFADDTVLIARTAEHIQSLLHIVQQEAAKYNLHLNLDKSKHISYNSDAVLYSSNGNRVPQVSSIVYLGGLIHQSGKPGPEVRRRVTESRKVFQHLNRVWKHARISLGKKLKIYRACVISKLVYNLSTLWLTESQNNFIDAFHFKCLRSIANIPTTWGAMQIGVERTSNEAVRERLKQTLLSDEIRLNQLQLLGHIIRRPQRHPCRIIAFDRFLQPQVLGGPYRAGVRREKWTEQVLSLATTIFNDHFFAGAGGVQAIKRKIYEVATDRRWWSSVLGQTRLKWRRQREGQDGARAHGEWKKKVSQDVN